MDFLSILRALKGSGAQFVIVGGVAACLYGSTRLTHDLDLVPALDPDTWPSLIATLYGLGGRPRIPETQESISDVSNIRSWIEKKGMLALSFRSPKGSVGVDLLVAKSHTHQSLLERATVVELHGEEFAIAGLDDLIEMKREAGRPQDLLDLEVLIGLRDRNSA